MLFPELIDDLQILITREIEEDIFLMLINRVTLREEDFLYFKVDPT